MSLNDPDGEDTAVYKVVVNHEEQYSIWPEDKDNPLGWKDAGKSGPKSECLAYIKEVWTDMRPLSLRKNLEEMARNPPPPLPVSNKPTEKSLVDKLCDGDHPVEVGLRPTKTTKVLKEAVDRNYVHIRFPETKGETELGIRLDRDACDFTKADFDGGNGTIHLEGGVTLDYVKVRCIADIDLKTLEGKGHLEKMVMGNAPDNLQ